MIPVLFNILFFLIPLVFYKNTAELFEFNKIVTLYLTTTIITSIWIINSIRAGKLIFQKTALDLPLLIYLFAMLLSTLFSIDPRTSWLGYYSRFNGGLFSQICYALLYWAFVSNLNRKEAFRVVHSILFSTVIASILAIGEHFGIFVTCKLMGFDWGKTCWEQDVQNRVYSTLGQPNWLASLLVALLPITWIFKIKTNNLKSLGYLFLSLIFFSALLFTKSRSGLIAFGVEFIIFWSLVFWQSKLEHIKKFIVLVLATVLLFVVFGIKAPVSKQPAATSGPVLESGGTESGTIRKFVWQGAFEVFKHHPILGTGAETFAFIFPKYKPVGHNLTSEWGHLYNKAHNEYLNYLATTGIVGFASYTFLIISTILIILKLQRFDLFAGYVGTLIMNFFGFSVVPTSLLFFLFPALAIIGSLDSVATVKQKEINDNRKVYLLLILSITFYLLFEIAKYWKADVYFSKARATNSLEEINKALSISPNEPNYISLLAYINSDKEISLKALNLNRYNQNTRKILISNLAKDERLNPDNLLVAEDVILEGIEMAPNDPRLYYQLGILQLKINKVEEGIKSLKKSVELKPNYKDGRFALGSTYKTLFQNTKAKEQFEYILKSIDPNDELTKKYLGEIE